MLINPAQSLTTNAPSHLWLMDYAYACASVECEHVIHRRLNGHTARGSVFSASSFREQTEWERASGSSRWGWAWYGHLSETCRKMRNLAGTPWSRPSLYCSYTWRFKSKPYSNVGSCNAATNSDVWIIINLHHKHTKQSRDANIIQTSSVYCTS